VWSNSLGPVTVLSDCSAQLWIVVPFSLQQTHDTWQRLSLKRNAFNAVLTFVTSKNTFITFENVGKDIISRHFNAFVI
jgi:hypothetical protein